MSEAGAQTAGPDTERLLDVGQVRAYRGPSLVLFLGISTAGSLAHYTFLSRAAESARAARPGRRNSDRR